MVLIDQPVMVRINLHWHCFLWKCCHRSKHCWNLSLDISPSRLDMVNNHCISIRGTCLRCTRRAPWDHRIHIKLIDIGSGVIWSCIFIIFCLPVMWPLLILINRCFRVYHIYRIIQVVVQIVVIPVSALINVLCDACSCILYKVGNLNIHIWLPYLILYCKCPIFVILRINSMRWNRVIGLWSSRSRIFWAEVTDSSNIIVFLKTIEPVRISCCSHLILGVIIGFIEIILGEIVVLTYIDIGCSINQCGSEYLWFRIKLPNNQHIIVAWFRYCKISQQWRTYICANASRILVVIVIIKLVCNKCIQINLVVPIRAAVPCISTIQCVSCLRCCI